MGEGGRGTRARRRPGEDKSPAGRGLEPGAGRGAGLRAWDGTRLPGASRCAQVLRRRSAAGPALPGRAHQRLPRLRVSQIRGGQASAHATLLDGAVLGKTLREGLGGGRKRPRGDGPEAQRQNYASEAHVLVGGRPGTNQAEK